MRRRPPLHLRYQDDILLAIRHLRRFNRIPRQDVRQFQNALIWDLEMPERLDYLLQALFVMALEPPPRQMAN